MRYDTRNRTSLSLRPNQSTTSMRPVLGRGEKGQDGSNVLPTDEAIEGSLESRGLPTTGTELSASIEAQLGDVADPENVAGYLTEAAVTAEVAARGLLGSTDAAEDLVTFTGEDARRSWLEILLTTGGPSAHSADLMWEVLSPLVGALAATYGLSDLDDDKYDYVFAITDENDRIALAIKNDGTVVVPLLESDGTLDPGSVTEEYLSADVVSRLWIPAQNASPYMTVGDSQTAAGSGYGNLLSAALSGAGVTVEAMGGHGLNEIAARQGGRPARVTVSGNQIPATVTAVGVTLDVDLLWRTVDTTGTTSRSCVLAGVPGTLIRDNVAVTYTFTRDVAGSAVWVSPGTAIRTANALNCRGSIQIFLAGRNGIHWTTAGSGLGAPWTPATLVDRVKQMVAYQHERGGRALVLELYPTQNTTTTDRIAREAEYNNLLREAFPDFFVPTTYYLLNRAMSDMGLTPTTQDLADIAAGVPPTSLMQDTTHLNAYGNGALATNVVAKEIIARGWN